MRTASSNSGRCLIQHRSGSAWCDGCVWPLCRQSDPAFAQCPHPAARMPLFLSINPQDPFCRIELEKTAECEVSVVGTDGQPVEGVQIDFCPNVMIAQGSSWFGAAVRMEREIPEFDSADQTDDPPLRRFIVVEDETDDYNLDFANGGRTDADGKISIRNLPGRGADTISVTRSNSARKRKTPFP